MIKVKRALISVSDKTGILDLARGLRALGVEILSTGGTASMLKSAQIPVTEVAEYTGFPEMLDGRVKTLHPAIHAGLLALREKPEHMQQMKDNGLGLIDMVVVNLYPFERTVEKKNVSLEEALENIDIGGPSMLRSAAKNFKSVAVVCNPKKYQEILKELDVNSGILSDSVLMNLAIEVFQYTSQYDNNIYHFLAQRLKGGEFLGLPKDLTLRFSKIQDLRYGENPHQKGAFYRDLQEKGGLTNLKQRHGKELSFNNILDLNAAVNLVRVLDKPAAVIVKHNNPTGIAEDVALDKAYVAALKCDPISAFGGIIGLNRKVDLKTAQVIIKSGFMECIVAPGFAPEAFKALSQKKNLRLLEIELDDDKKEGLDFKKVDGGLLVQEKDIRQLQANELTVATRLKPTKAQLEAMIFGWKIIRDIKSNAVILVKGTKTVGIGCGQTSRVDATKTAILKAGKDAKGAVLVSDAFLPKVDNVTFAAKAGVKAIIQTGGSVVDPDTIKEANKRKIAMVMTGIRHFKH